MTMLLMSDWLPEVKAAFCDTALTLAVKSTVENPRLSKASLIFVRTMRLLASSSSTVRRSSPSWV